MKNIIKTLPIILLLTFVGCNDLSETVYSDVTMNGYNYKASEIYSVIGPVYQNMRDFTNPWNYTGVNENTTDILCQPANSSGWDDGGIFKRMHMHTWTSEEVQINNLWSTLYTGVLHANRIIGQLESKSVPIPSDESYESFIAEMKVARAFYYWLLIDNFGDVPFITPGSQELPVKTARALIYEAIVSDIESSMSNLNSENNSKMYGRFNKWGAKALLANLYLNAEVYTGTTAWDKCLSECNDIIASSKYSLEPNYTDCFWAHNENSVETIFAIPFDEIYGGGLYVAATLDAASKDKYNLADSPWGCGAVKAVSQFIDTYDSDDSRVDGTWEHGLQFAADGVTPLLGLFDKKGQQINYSKNITNGLFTTEDEGYRVIKFKPEMGARFNLNNDFPFFRYAQVKLMKAECLIRTGQADAAAVIVTEIRQRAFKAHPEKAIVTGDQLIADSKFNWGYYVKDYGTTTPGGLDKGDQTQVQYGGFYDELGYEFACEATRRRDMIRFGTYTTKSWLSHKPNGAYRTLFPIPQSAIDANSSLVQNMGY